MKVQVIENAPDEIKMEIEVEKETINSVTNEVFKKAGRSINIKGFRRGKTPLPILKRFLDKELVKKEIVEEVVPEAYYTALGREFITPITSPNFDIDPEKLDEDKPFNFSVTFKIKPKIDVLEYKGIEIEHRKEEITSKDVDDYIKGIAEGAAKLYAVEEDRGLEKGDFGICNFVSTVDGSPVANGKAENHLFELAEDKLLKDFYANILGLKKGETKEFMVKFPEDYPADELKNKDVLFNFTLTEIKKKVYPEINDEFAKSNSEFATLNELKDSIELRLNENLERIKTDLLRRKIIDKLVAENEKIELSKELMDYKLEYLLYDFDKRLRSEGVDLEQYCKKTGTKLNKLKEEFTPQAEKLLKEELIIESIAEKEKISATIEEIKEEIKTILESEKSKGKVNVEEVYIKMEKENTTTVLRGSIIRKKVFDFLYENAKVVLVDKKPEETEVKDEGEAK